MPSDADQREPAKPGSTSEVRDVSSQDASHAAVLRRILALYAPADLEPRAAIERAIELLEREAAKPIKRRPVQRERKYQLKERP